MTVALEMLLGESVELSTNRIGKYGVVVMLATGVEALTTEIVAFVDVVTVSVGVCAGADVTEGGKEVLMETDVAGAKVVAVEVMTGVVDPVVVLEVLLEEEITVDVVNDSEAGTVGMIDVDVDAGADETVVRAGLDDDDDDDGVDVDHSKLDIGEVDADDESDDCETVGEGGNVLDTDDRKRFAVIKVEDSVVEVTLLVSSAMETGVAVVDSVVSGIFGSDVLVENSRNDEFSSPPSATEN